MTKIQFNLMIFLIIFSSHGALCKSLADQVMTHVWNTLLFTQYDHEEDSDKKLVEKSIFQAPTFRPDCGYGYTMDWRGKCVKVVKVDPNIHEGINLNVLLHKFANATDSGEVTKNEAHAERFHIDLPVYSNVIQDPLGKLKNRNKKRRTPPKNQNKQPGVEITTQVSVATKYTTAKNENLSSSNTRRKLKSTRKIHATTSSPLTKFGSPKSTTSRITTIRNRTKNGKKISRPITQTQNLSSSTKMPNLNVNFVNFSIIAPLVQTTEMPLNSRSRNSNNEKPQIVNTQEIMPNAAPLVQTTTEKGNATKSGISKRRRPSGATSLAGKMRFRQRRRKNEN